MIDFKFEVGDVLYSKNDISKVIVIIRSYETCGQAMYHYIKLGETHTVYASSKEDIENIFRTENEINKEFTKDMLETGMVVELRNGHVGMIMSGKIIDSKTYVSLSDYNDNLYDKRDSGYDIMKIYEEPKDLLCFNDLNITSEYTLIWQRQEKSPIKLEIERMKAEKAEYDKKFNDRIAELESKL